MNYDKLPGEFFPSLSSASAVGGSCKLSMSLMSIPEERKVVIFLAVLIEFTNSSLNNCTQT